MGVLTQGRFTLGLGAGENLNEHVIGAGLAVGQHPARDVRRGRRDHQGAVRRRLRRPTGASSSTVDSAKLYDLPDRPVPDRRSPPPAGASGDLAAPSTATLLDRRSSPTPSSWSGSARTAARASRSTASSPSRYDTDAEAPRSGRTGCGAGRRRVEGHGRAARARSTSPPPHGSCARRTSPSRCRAATTWTPWIEAVRKFADAGFTHVALVPDRRRAPAGVPHLGGGRPPPGPAGTVRMTRRARRTTGRETGTVKSR